MFDIDKVERQLELNSTISLYSFDYMYNIKFTIDPSPKDINYYIFITDVTYITLKNVLDQIIFKDVIWLL